MKQNKSAISRFQDFLETQKGQTILNYLYSWGAAIVILGALFKLTHINGADLMLFLGMGTEVLTFIVNGFERQSSAKETEAPAASGPVIIGGGAPVATGAVVSAPVTNVAPAVATSAVPAPQLDAEALTAMANIAAANAAVAAASAGTTDMGELKERTQDNDGSTPAVEVVQYGLSLFSFQEILKAADSTFILFHMGWFMFYFS